MGRAPRATEAFDELLATLAEVRDQYVLSEERHTDELEVLEGYRYVLQILSEAGELLVEGDPERPRFSEIVWPARKLLGDNPDSLYQQAWIRGDRRYRIRGRKKEQCYISFTIHGDDPDGGLAGAVQADVNDDGLGIGPDGSFELILSPKEEPGALQLQPDARLVIVRNYYLHERSAQTDPSVFVELEIEPLDEPGPAPADTDEVLADRLRKTTQFLRATTFGLRVFGVPNPMKIRFVADEPNSVGIPSSFRQAGLPVAGAVDIYYSTGAFDLGPDEALVMEGTIPPSRFTNVMLWNVHMQTLDYRSRRSSLNAAQIRYEADGSYRIVISEKDPGVPNWLDTAGHRRGTIFWRFLLPESDPETPRCRVVPVGEVA